MRNCRIHPVNKTSFRVETSSREIRIFSFIRLLFYISRRTIVYLYTHIEHSCLIFLQISRRVVKDMKLSNTMLVYFIICGEKFPAFVTNQRRKKIYIEKGMLNFKTGKQFSTWISTSTFRWFIPVVCDYNIKYQIDIKWVCQNATKLY
jgi:hypothetical protein